MIKDFWRYIFPLNITQCGLFKTQMLISIIIFLMEPNLKTEESVQQQTKIDSKIVEQRQPQKEPNPPTSHFCAEITDNEGKKSVIIFDERLKKFDSIFARTEFEHLNFNIIKDPHLMRKVQEFFRRHDYDQAKIQIKRPMVSNKFQENVDEITYDVLKDYEKDENQQDAVKLIQIAEYLAIPEFKNAIYSAVSSKFFIGSTEEDLEKFRDQHNLHELSVNEQEAIIKEYNDTFTKLQKRLQAELVKLEAELPNN